MNEIEAKEFAQSISNFFLVFDSLFLYDENAEEYLKEVKSSLKEKVSWNESDLAVIFAMGGNYDSGIDNAKIKEVEALLDLIKARKGVQKATEEEKRKSSNNREMLTAMFG